MRVTQVSIRPTEAAEAAGRPALTPELLAATGARYSRSNEGLDAILSRIDPTNLDRSVDGIFRMIDYGHQSIADMTPVAMFIDELSIYLAYLVWGWCPLAGGQESSTRYIKLSADGVVDPHLLGLPDNEQEEWHAFIADCFRAYTESLQFWETISKNDPDISGIPRQLLIDPSEKAQKTVARMRRNFAFDRSRYFLPVAAKTNMMLCMSARGWVQLCQQLLSHSLPEARGLGIAIRSELNYVAPRLVKHAELKSSIHEGHLDELARTASLSQSTPVNTQAMTCISSVEVFPPEGVSIQQLAAALNHHDNRYAYIGTSACRTAVRFGWNAVALAEIRDLNRHRTGTKFCPLVPVGFYSAQDQVPERSKLDRICSDVGVRSTVLARKRLTNKDSGFAGWLLLGSQFAFEHTTTLDKFIYEAELRTGTGAHYRYASHLRDAVAVLGSRYPELSSMISLGANEPE